MPLTARLHRAQLGPTVLLCALVLSVDSRTNILRVVSVIDNLVKGQAGSALQNMNLIFGLPETTGLDVPGMFP